MGRFKFNRADKREARRKSATAQQEERAKRSPQQQLAHLDSVLGPGVGAKRERERLQKLIAG